MSMPIPTPMPPTHPRSTRTTGLLQAAVGLLMHLNAAWYAPIKHSADPAAAMSDYGATCPSSSSTSCTRRRSSRWRCSLPGSPT